MTSKRLSAHGLQDTSLMGMVGTESGEIDFDKLVDVAKKSREWNKFLWKMVVLLLVFGFFSILAVFGVSIAAAVIAKDTKIDASTGFMYAKAGGDDGGFSILKTAEAMTALMNVDVHGLPAADLPDLESVKFMDVALSFNVKGFARGEDVTVLLIEGGTLTFDETGLTGTTGDGPSVLFNAVDVDPVDGVRKLQNDEDDTDDEYIKDKIPDKFEAKNPDEEKSPKTEAPTETPPKKNNDESTDEPSTDEPSTDAPTETPPKKGKGKRKLLVAVELKNSGGRFIGGNGVYGSRRYYDNSVYPL